MRFYIVLVTLSLFIWVASAGVSGVSHPKAKAVDTDASAGSADAAGADALLGPPAPVPAGPRTPAEEQADAALSCIEKCTTGTECENACVYSTYNVPVAAGVPSVSAVVPGPVNTASSTASGAVPSTTASPAAGKGSSASALNVGLFTIGIAATFASFASFMF
ncbi:hypothetical protein BGZ83_003978 [Gryganskiella cystojenkinii]|nr:hypothetical protein BGZ83_003978 [Gryganskiella cystojenkinii]